MSDLRFEDDFNNDFDDDLEDDYGYDDDNIPEVDFPGTDNRPRKDGPGGE